MQHIFPDYDNEIVLLSKTSYAIPSELKEAILKIHPERPQLAADDKLRLEDRLHFVRKVDDRLEVMTEKQFEYVENNQINISESNTKDTISKSESHRYIDDKNNPEMN